MTTSTSDIFSNPSKTPPPSNHLRFSASREQKLISCSTVSSSSSHSLQRESDNWEEVSTTFQLSPLQFWAKVVSFYRRVVPDLSSRWNISPVSSVGFVESLPHYIFGFQVLPVCLILVFSYITVSSYPPKFDFVSGL